jgi:transposase-like protein
MAKHITATLKETIPKEMKEGAKVAELSVRHGVSSNTTCGWTKASADNSGTSLLEVARLRRENHDLKLIIGALTLEKGRAEKNTGGPRRHAGR